MSLIEDIDRSCLGTTVTVGALTPDPADPLHVIAQDLTDPGRAAEHWRILKNPRTAIRERQALFLGPLAAAIAAALAPPDKQPNSPLIEGLASFGNLPRQIARQIEGDEITAIVSDLRQNSGCSFHDRRKTEVTLAQRCADVIAEHPLQMRGEVVILGPNAYGIFMEDWFRKRLPNRPNPIQLAQIYGALKALLLDGLIEPARQAPKINSFGRPAVVYRLTQKGEIVLHYLQAIRDVSQEEQTSDGAQASSRSQAQTGSRPPGQHVN